MPSELTLAIQQICEEKGLPLELIKSTIEAALAAAYRKDFGTKLQNIKVEFDMETGGFKVFDEKEVVSDELKEETEKLKAQLLEEKEKKTTLTQASQTKEGEKESSSLTSPTNESVNKEEMKRYNPKSMITVSEAQEIKKGAKEGEIIKQELTVPAEFGRMAAQTAKQVIIQKLREAERETLLEEYQNKQNELIGGVVQRLEGKLVLVDLGNITAIMPPIEQIKNEVYKPGMRLKFYIKSVEQTPKGPSVTVSRSHPEMVRKIFKLEVPEINSGSVQIKAVAREAGSRSKIAVYAKDESIDPIGSCVGQRGTRVQTIINELGGEKIDIIEWNEDVEKFIINALSPAKIIKVELNEKEKQVRAFVKEDQYSLAIGKEGQNVRLAAKLVGWRIDIVQEDRKAQIESKVERLEKEKKKEVEEQKEEELEEKKPEPNKVPFSDQGTEEEKGTAKHTSSADEPTNKEEKSKEKSKYKKEETESTPTMDKEEKKDGKEQKDKEEK